MSRSQPIEAAPRAWLHTAWITGAAIAVFVGVRLLPIDPGGLHYTDFNSGGAGVLELCEPGSPQFVPVDRVRSPVEMELVPETPMTPGRRVAVRLRLRTSGGKPVTVDDLLVSHTEKLHLLIIDRSLGDYQHVHPAPADEPGEFLFEYTPHHAGEYRAFADFTPRATGRALYAGATLLVSGGEATRAAAREVDETRIRVDDGIRYVLAADEDPLRINTNDTLSFTAERLDGAPLVFDEIMGASAHLVAFDEARSGFAHLHPIADPLLSGPEVPTGGRGGLTFSLYLTDPGIYRLWAQVKIDGRERFVPFDLRVVP